MAGCGLRRLSGSHARHLEMKSMKSSSSHLSTEASDLVPGRRRLPLALTNGRGAPVASVAVSSDRMRPKLGLTEEMLPPRRLFDDVPIRYPEDLHNTRKLLLLILAGKDWHSSVQLREDTPDSGQRLSADAEHRLTQDSTCRSPSRNSCPESPRGSGKTWTGYMCRLHGHQLIPSCLIVPFSVSRQLEPKSMTLIPLLHG
jgi:hypothetical protein